MTTLHIVRQSVFNNDDFVQCIQVLGINDVITFIDDGCYNLQHSLISTIDKSLNIQLTVIEQHANARAIAIDENIIAKITMKDLVTLTFANNTVITWQ